MPTVSPGPKAEREQSKQDRKQLKKLEQELRGKDKALVAEAAALLVLPKRAQAIWGGRQGRMISPADRRQAVALIKEAVAAGARHTRPVSCWRSARARTYK